MNEEPLEVIKCNQISYKNYECIKGEPDYLALYETYAEHKWKFSARFVDPQTGEWTEERSYIGICTIPKSHICFTTAGYTYNKEMFHIEIKSLRDEIILVVDTIKEARAIHKVITDWLYS